MSVNHTIQQLIFEIEGFESNSQFQTIASRISSLVRTTIEREIDRLLQQYNIDGYHIIIEQLEIDLGYININNLAYNLANSLRRELNKNLKRISTQAVYDVKHKDVSTIAYIEKKDVTLDTILSKKQIETPYQLNKDPRHYFPGKLHQRVVPEDARYFDAVIHYLEYGWIPRYLDIPMLQFDKILVDTLSTYGQEVMKHFGRKPKKQNDKVVERILRQTSKNKLLKSNKKARKVLANKVLGITEDDQIQAFLNIFEHISTSSQSMTAEQRKNVKIWTKEIAVSSSVLDKIIEVDETKHVGFNVFEEIDRRIDEILDSNDKTLFKELLETKFYKSLVKGYVSKTDSNSILIRTLLPLILEPSRREEILNLAPVILESEDELINQLYSKSPYLVNKSLLSISKYASSPNIIFSKIASLFNTISKKHVNKIVKSFFSYSTLLSKQLNFINSHITSETHSDFHSFIFQSLTGDKVDSVVNTVGDRLSQIQLVSFLIIFSTKSPTQVASDYVRAVKTYVAKQEDRQKLITVFKKFQLDEKVKERTYKEFEKADAILLQSLDQEQTFLKQDDSSELTQYRLKTLLQHYYLPQEIMMETKADNESKTKSDEVATPSGVQTNDTKEDKERSKEESTRSSQKDQTDITDQARQSSQTNQSNQSSQSNQSNQSNQSSRAETKSQEEKLRQTSELLSLDQSVTELIQNITAQKISKKVLLELFKEANILKNQVLSRLSDNNFKQLINAVLPTTQARSYLNLFNKYQTIFKIHIDKKEIQLIFLSLIKHRKELNESNIFRHFYENLKQYKGWTYDKHKEKLIAMYEKRSDDLTQVEKDHFINYVDTIPTYLGLELKDTKKKLEQGIPIKNAGLSLLWPFFKTLFSVSDYLDSKGDFKSKEMRERATLLLQYLAVKSTAIEEPYLALNKIFTGLPLEDSIPSEIVLTEKEKDIADALLLNVIKQWPSFNNSSPDNLRGSFIIRDGVLFFRGKQWILRVENKAYDLLLGKLPWGFSMIRLSWIPYIIKVEWN